MAKVVLEKIRKRYENAAADTVKELNLEIADKEFLVLVGPSGCGKSTTLRMIAGLEEITEGNIYIGNDCVTKLPGSRRNVAMVFQNYALYPHMNVFENMCFALRMQKASNEVIEKRVKLAAEILGLEDLLQRKPKDLSGGQRQRVALGRAIVRDPKVFLMDEPLSNLDAKLRVKMRVELSKLHNRLQTTTVYVTHDQVEAMTMGTRIAVMNDGILQQCDDPEVVYEKPGNLFVAGFIGSPAMNFFDCRVNLEGDSTWFNNGLFHLKAPKKESRQLAAFTGHDLILGIRPEHIFRENDSRVSHLPGENSFQAKVEVVEVLGGEVIATLERNGCEITARFNAKDRPHVDETINLVLDMDSVHVFDKKSGERLELEN
ncbi:MAG: sn-glycerol-3-phosphate ABC transporter ATP-binding protein UgpC [Candidatus Wallbacteria bacterium]|nr:sn-glycerol-3-phosphate ABC transporter ATP-binding protein UgpC [Candidatus Wallbacteria bacterium]